MVGGDKELKAVMEAVRGYQHWGRLQSELESAECLAMVVSLRPQEEGKFPRDCVAVFAVSAEEGQPLRGARGFRVLVFDVKRRKRLRESLGRRLGSFFRELWPQAGGEVEVVEMPTPGCVAPNECCLVCLGALLGVLASGAGLEVDVKKWVASSRFVASVGRQVRFVFDALRKVAAETEARDVLQCEGMQDADGCRELLEGLTDWGVGAGGEDSGSGSEAEVVAGVGQGAAGMARVADGVSVGVSRVVVDDMAPVRVLTWNVDGLGKSRSAPASFTVVDKLAAVQLEILRWGPEVVSLQECPKAAALDVVGGERYELVGAAPAHSGYVHLYVRRGVKWGCGVVLEGLPAVVAEVQLAGEVLCVAAVHLAPGADGASERREQLARVLGAMRGKHVLVLGDVNAREAEVEEICELWEGGLDDARYLGRSWDMRENKYFEEYRGQGGSAPAYCFDRILLGGGVFAAAYLVGHARCFGDEDAFALSDHYGLMGLLDVHEAHAGARGGRVAVRRREALGLARDQAASRERVVARELQAAALEQARQQRSRAEEGEVAERLNLARRREAAERRERYEATFGRESFFACADWVERVAEVPVSPGASQEVRLAGYEGLARASVQAGWERRGRYPFLSGFLNVRNTCFAASVMQVLLRVPAVIVWLDAHAQLCSRGRDECLTCALRETQGQLGVRGAEPFLCRQEAIARVGAFFADG